MADAPVAKPQAVPNAATIAALVSPVTGEVVALEQVPDEAFASKAVGDGVAVKANGENRCVSCGGHHR